MPRPKKEGAAQPKRRSRYGCWPCKARKIKCGEEKPSCLNCQKQGEECDYSIRLNWDGRKRKPDDNASSSPWSTTPISFDSDSHTTIPSSSKSPAATSAANHTVLQTGQRPPSSQQSPRSFPLTPAQSEELGHPSPFAGANTSQDAPTSRPRKRQRSNNASADLSRDLQGQQAVDPTLASVEAYFHVSPLPPTPGSPEAYKHQRVQSLKPILSDDDKSARRLSVRSLLSPDVDELENIPVLGFDQGRPDIDMPRNDDANALQAFSPSSTLRQLNLANFDYDYEDDDKMLPLQFGFGLQPMDHRRLDQSEYYAEPVPIKIPPDLMPLPEILTENSMNLLYFHHFLNHTAKILVPHDCPLNPFRSILPQMAIQSRNLMSLLLAYSASHRARFLNHPEPATRIARWTKDVFTNLRRALANNDVSDSTLGAAIMLASMEIISPGAWGISISWKSHLGLARQMIIARGGYRLSDRTNKVSSFLGRWFAYLDVLGSLSGSNYDRPLYNPGPPDELQLDDTDMEIDCVLGFTSRCVMILAQIADLAKRCDAMRMRPDGTVDTEWKPPQDIVEAANTLKASLERARLTDPRACTHGKAEVDVQDGASAAEMIAVNEAYHLAGLIHIYCRILNEKSEEPSIQAAVSDVVETLRKIRPDSSAEACLVFPIFTAGCEARDKEQRKFLLERLLSVEKSGLTQANKARTLMERVWDTGEYWETLVSDEFVG